MHVFTSQEEMLTMQGPFPEPSFDANVTIISSWCILRPKVTHARDHLKTIATTIIYPGNTSLHSKTTTPTGREHNFPLEGLSNLKFHLCQHQSAKVNTIRLHIVQIVSAVPLKHFFGVVVIPSEWYCGIRIKLFNSGKNQFPWVFPNKGSSSPQTYLINHPSVVQCRRPVLSITKRHWEFLALSRKFIL